MHLINRKECRIVDIGDLLEKLIIHCDLSEKEALSRVLNWNRNYELVDNSKPYRFFRKQITLIDTTKGEVSYVFMNEEWI